MKSCFYEHSNQRFAFNKKGLMIFASFCVAICVSLISSTAIAADFDVMSFNVRLDAGIDGANDWGFVSDPRKDKVVTTISNYNPDILGIQEAFGNQVVDLRNSLSGYKYFGTQAGDGSTAGEAAGIFFRSDRFYLLEGGNYWLSDTPDIPGTIFDSAVGSDAIQTATWAKLYDVQSKTPYLVVNSHWYENSQTSREATANLIRDKVNEQYSHLPIVMLGSFGANESSTEVTTLMGQGSPSEFQLLDSYRQINSVANPAIDGTSHGFTGATTGPRNDYIFYTDNLKLIDASIDHTDFSGSQPSDHFPVTATIRSNVFPFADTFDEDPRLNGWATIDDEAAVTNIIGGYEGPVGVLEANGQGQATFVNITGGGVRPAGHLTRTIDTTGFESIALNLTAFQLDIGDPENELLGFESNDFLRIEYNTGSGWITLLEDAGQWEGVNDPPTPFGQPNTGTHEFNDLPTSTGDLALPVAAADNPNLEIRIYMAANAVLKEVYLLDDLVVSGSPIVLAPEAAAVPEPNALFMGVFGMILLFVFSIVMNKRRQLTCTFRNSPLTNNG